MKCYKEFTTKSQSIFHYHIVDGDMWVELTNHRYTIKKEKAFVHYAFKMGRNMVEISTDKEVIPDEYVTLLPPILIAKVRVYEGA